MKRQLPLSHQMGLYFNGYIIAGALILILGTWLCFSIIDIEELSAEDRLKEATVTTKGYLIEKWEAEWNDNGMPILHGYDYYFIHPDLGQLTNTSFSSKILATSNLNELEIIYSQDNPYLNKVVGMDYTDRSKASLLTILIPIVGIMLLIIGIRKARFRKHLLRVGKFVWGTFIKHEKTSVTINDQPQFRLYYEYETRDKTVYSQQVLSTKPSDFDKEELIIYDPEKPSDSVLLYVLSYLLAKYIEKNWAEAKV